MPMALPTRIMAYCYKDGEFTQDMTMEQMFDYSAQFTDEVNKNSGQNLLVERVKSKCAQPADA